MSNRLRIETPEGVVFTFTLASPVARSLAWMLDAAITITAAQVVGQVTTIAAMISPDFAQAIAIVSYFVVSIVYGIVFEWFWRGQTVGKRLFRLRVVDAQGLRLHFSQVALRNLLRAVDVLPLFYLVGGVACLVGKRSQRLGDLAANTIVLREPAAAKPDLRQIAPARYNSLEAWPHLAARLRSRVRPEAAAVAVSALVSRDRFAAAARLTLFAELADYFRELTPFPDEAVEGLTDEQYVRSVVRVLYR